MQILLSDPDILDTTNWYFGIYLNVLEYKEAYTFLLER